MNFTKDASIHNTCLQGIATIDYKTLVEIFGEPNYGPDMISRDKVSCEWDLEFEDGMIATIYDWHEEWTSYSTYPWHVGGHSQAAFQRIMKLIENHLEEKSNG